MPVMPYAASYKDKRVLVTGGAGYLATNLLPGLRDVDRDGVRLDRPGTRFPPGSGRRAVSDWSFDQVLQRTRAVLEGR